MPMHHGGPVDCVALGNRSRAGAPESGREALAYACTWAWRGPGCRPLTGTHHRTSVTAHRPRPVLSGRAPRDGVPPPVWLAGRLSRCSAGREGRALALGTECVQKGDPPPGAGSALGLDSAWIDD